MAAPLGHEVRLICPPQARIYAEAPAWYLPAIAAPIGRRRPVGLKCMVEWFRHNRCDVISTHSATDSWLVALAMLTLGRPYPVVRTQHDAAPVPRNPWTRWLYTRAISRIVTLDEPSKARLVERNGGRAARVDALPAGPALLDTMEQIYRQASRR